MADDLDVDDGAALERAPKEIQRHPLVRSQRTVQVVLGLLWILDAALQFQPYMFSKNFVPRFVLANASGQPAVIHWVITNVGNFLAPHPAVWNALFASVQLVIGVGLLFRRTVRLALALSFPYVLGVWVFGEGLGMLLTGSATALTGAPGSVLLYALIGLMAWPRKTTGRREVPHDGEAGIGSSAAARGIGGPITPLAVWSGFWVLAAVLFLLPDNRTQSSIGSAITGMAPGNPSWYSHFLDSTGHQFGAVGTQTAWVLAVISLAIGLGPLLARRPGPFLTAGAILTLIFWITGQGLLGGIFTGSGTDPNTGPLIILLALAMMPTKVLADAPIRGTALGVIGPVESSPGPGGRRAGGSCACALCGVSRSGPGDIGHGYGRHGRHGRHGRQRPVE